MAVVVVSVSPILALNRRADRPPLCPVLGAFLPRQPMTAEAAYDPRRHFPVVN
jgi:hypothetical protein